jgi:hypothetical protein
MRATATGHPSLELVRTKSNSYGRRGGGERATFCYVLGNEHVLVKLLLILRLSCWVGSVVKSASGFDVVVREDGA